MAPAHNRDLCRLSCSDDLSEQYVSPYHIAYVHTGLGDKERTMDLTNSSSVACPDGQSDIRCGSRLIA
jgi:hypothetical protein